MTPFHAHAIAIGKGDIDELGHVNNAVYLRWVQDAVVEHWKAVAPAEAIARHLWIALKHEISVRRPAFLSDELTATATIRRFDGVRAFCRTSIGRGGELLAEVESCWCCLDATSRRPIRLAECVKKLFVSEPN